MLQRQVDQLAIDQQVYIDKIAYLEKQLQRQSQSMTTQDSYVNYLEDTNNTLEQQIIKINEDI